MGIGLIISPWCRAMAQYQTWALTLRHDASIWTLECEEAGFATWRVSGWSGWCFDTFHRRHVLLLLRLHKVRDQMYSHVFVIFLRLGLVGKSHAIADRSIAVAHFGWISSLSIQKFSRSSPIKSWSPFLFWTFALWRWAGTQTWLLNVHLQSLWRIALLSRRRCSLLFQWRTIFLLVAVLKIFVDVLAALVFKLDDIDV